MAGADARFASHRQRPAMPVTVTEDIRPALLEVEHVGKRFPGVEALRDASLSLHRGEVHVLLGQNAAGKSTLAKCISGVYPPDSGRIVLEGVGCVNPAG